MSCVFTLLAEPNRRRILDLLRGNEQAAGELANGLALNQPAVSKCLRALRGGGLVDVRIDAPRRVYRLRLAALREIDDWLAPYRTLWSQSLDELEGHLKATAGGRCTPGTLIASGRKAQRSDHQKLGKRTRARAEVPSRLLAEPPGPQQQNRR